MTLSNEPSCAKGSAVHQHKRPEFNAEASMQLEAAIQVLAVDPEGAVGSCSSDLGCSSGASGLEGRSCSSSGCNRLRGERHNGEVPGDDGGWKVFAGREWAGVQTECDLHEGKAWKGKTAEHTTNTVSTGTF